MATKPRVSFSAAGRGDPSPAAPVPETSSNRRRIQDVLGQARAALRQSQQFRSIPADSKNNTLGNKLQFQQQPQDDYWSSPGAGGVIPATDVQKDKVSKLTKDRYASSNEDSLSKSSYSHSQPHRSQQDDFRTPFHDAVKRTQRPPPHLPEAGSQNRKLQLAQVNSVDTLLSDASTTSISMNTNELRVSSGSEDYSSSEDSKADNSQGSVKKSTLKSATTRSSKKEEKLREWKQPSTVKLTPLNTATTPPMPAIPTEGTGGEGQHETSVIEEELSGEGEQQTSEIDAPRTPTPSTVGKVTKDDMGFSRAEIMKSEDDPHWFEKALLARGETISEAAYKAFKHTQSTQLKQQEDNLVNANVAAAVKQTRGKPIFKNLSDPEYTADWISDGGVASSMSASVVDMPLSDYIKDENILSSKGEVEIDSVVLDDDDINTESMIRTATELEQSGILEEISENLHSVLDISDHPESQNFSGMSAEEKSFAKEYDEVMQDADEPLQSIFVDEVQSSITGSKAKGSKSFSGQDKNISSQRHHTGTERSGTKEEEGDDYDDNTFIQLDSTMSSLTKSKSVSKRRSSKSLRQSSSSSMPGKEKKTSSTENSSHTIGGTKSGSKSVKVKTSSSSGTGSSSQLEKSKSKSISKSKSYASTSSSSSKRLSSLPIPPDPPTSTHQKNIQNILEKEVYQKEVKRLRSEKIRVEKSQDKMKKVAKESLERNKQTTWKDPDYTEILLPELFKYKSVSGLQAAKAKRSMLAPSMNFGAPYFQMNGAVSSGEGTEAMLAAAKVESLDIPDLVREVLASNERMYRMTVEASEQMAKKAYKDKVRKEMKRSVHRKQ